MNSLLLLATLALLTSCSISPMGSTHTARSNGAGEASFNLGNMASSFYTQSAIGLSKDFDLGFVFEFGSYTTSGLTAKYSLINNKTGPAWAVEASYGGSEKSEYNYIGTVLSYQMGEAIELFLNARHNSINMDEDEYNIGDEVGLVEIKKHNFHYTYLAYGLNIWPVPDFGLSLYAASVMGSEIQERSNAVGLALLFKL